MQSEQPLQVARCTKIINADSEDSKYIINVKQFAKFVVDLAEQVASTDIEEGMRVGVDRNKYQVCKYCALKVKWGSLKIGDRRRRVRVFFLFPLKNFFRETEFNIIFVEFIFNSRELKINSTKIILNSVSRKKFFNGNKKNTRTLRLRSPIFKEPHFTFKAQYLHT